MQNLDFSQNKYLLSASFLAATSAMAWYFTSAGTERCYYSDGDLIKVSKAFKKNMYPVFIDIATKVKGLKLALQRKGKDPERLMSQIKSRAFDKSKAKF